MFTIDASEKEKLNEIMNKAGIKYINIEGCSTIAKVGDGGSVALAYDREGGRLYNLGSYLIDSLLLVPEVENRLVR